MFTYNFLRKFFVLKYFPNEKKIDDLKMYEEEQVELNNFQLSNSTCCACLCRTRKIVLLGEYAGIFNKIVNFTIEDNQRVKVCWECLAVLKKIKIFETKCCIAQKILQTKWVNRHPPKCLSTLVMTPVKVDMHFDEDINEANHGFKFEEKPTINEDNVTSNIAICENYIHCNSSEVYYHTKFEDTASLEDHMDSRSDNEYSEYLNNKKIGNDYLTYRDKDTNLKRGKINKNNILITTVDGEVASKIECKTFNNDSNRNTNSIDLREEVKSYCNSESSQHKLNENVKSARRKGLRKKDLEEHFTIVGVTSSEMKKFKSKFKIDSGELDFWRETERSIDYYVDQPYKCHYCICGFYSLKKKYEHDKKYHDKATGVFTCDICTAQFISKQKLTAHVSKHYQMHRCNLCQFRCMSRHHMKWHMRRHKRLVMCAHCDACFSNVGLFYKHFKANHSIFICDHCGKTCRTKYTLEKHMRHHSEKNICLICNKVYASRNSLRNHSEMKHKETSSEMAYCVKCDKQFPNVPLYKRHVQSSKAHAAERDADRSKKQVNCPICGNVYSRKTYMMNHYRHVHMKQSKHYCTDCDRHFLNRTRYVEHRKYHHEGETKAKNKMCNICGRGFAANRTLVNHIRTHSGERPYECQYCDAKFTQKHGMLSHIKYIHMKSKRRGFP